MFEQSESKEGEEWGKEEQRYATVASSSMWTFLLVLSPRIRTTKGGESGESERRCEPPCLSYIRLPEPLSPWGIEQKIELENDRPIQSIEAYRVG
jgi:hypothetical protein